MYSLSIPYEEQLSFSECECRILGCGSSLKSGYGIQKKPNPNQATQIKKQALNP